MRMYVYMHYAFDMGAAPNGRVMVVTISYRKIQTAHIQLGDYLRVAAKVMARLPLVCLAGRGAGAAPAGADPCWYLFFSKKNTRRSKRRSSIRKKQIHTGTPIERQ
jgi:hypothetical protein